MNPNRKSRRHRQSRRTPKRLFRCPYSRAYEDDANILRSVRVEVRLAQRQTEQLIRKQGNGRQLDFPIRSRKAASSMYPVTENWQKAIGGHPLWGAGRVRYDPCTEIISMDLDIEMEDYYNFNRGESDIATGALDADNGRFVELGWTKNFSTRGKMKWRLEWQLGKPASTTHVIDGDKSFATAPPIQPTPPSRGRR